MANTARLVIDPIARKISTKYEKIRLVQQDNNSMRVTFEMPRVVRGHDMSNCSTVEVHYDNISFDRKKVNSDIYTVTDICVAPEDEDTINFSWLVSRAATQLQGVIEFSLHFGCTEDASLEYAWHTTTYSGIVVLAGKHNTNTTVKQYPDAFDELRKDIYKKIEEAVANANSFDKELEKKLDRLDPSLKDAFRLYAHLSDGSDGTLTVASSPNSTYYSSVSPRIPMYHSSGAGTKLGNTAAVLLTGTPQADYDAANKKYVDESISDLGIDAVREDIVSVTKDVETLKEAAEGNLYDFHEVTTSDKNYLSVQPEALGGYMISEIGGYKDNVIYNLQNLVLNLQLPYFVTSKPDTLSFGFDAADGTLVLNGTMQAGEELLISYSAEIDTAAYSSGIFYRGGTVATSGADPAIRFRLNSTDNSAICETAVQNGDTTKTTLTHSYIGQYVNFIEITAPNGATFTNYKFNLAFCVGDPPEEYEEPSFLKAIQSKPKAFFIEGKNRWNGAAEATGVKSIDFVAQSPIPAGEYTLFLDQIAERSGGFKVELMFEGGTTSSNTLIEGEYAFTAVAPLTGFKVYAKTNDRNSEDVALIVKNVMLVRKIPNATNERPSEFIPYHDDITVEIPEYLRGLDGYGVAVNPSNYNKIDLDELYYTKNCALYTIDGNTNFEEVEEGVFALSDIYVTSNDRVFTSGLFTVTGEDDTFSPFRIWYDENIFVTEKLVVVLGEGHNLDDLKALVSRYPFYLGVVKTASKFTLDAGEILAGNCEIYLPVVQGDTVTIIGEDGQPTNNATVGYIYQRKL